MAISWSWVREPDHFDWVSAYLTDRNYLPTARSIMVLITASSALAPISTLTRMPDSLVANTVGVIGALLALALTILWSTWWPTRGVSLFCVSAGALCAAAWSLSQSSPLFAAIAAMTLAVTGAYMGFFHSAAVLLGNCVLAIGTIAVITYRIDERAGTTTALAVFWLSVLIIIALPLGVRGTTHAMRQYAIASDHDALTGLLNRRGFATVIDRTLTGRQRSPGHEHLIVLMVDLDNFKALNDTHGHAVGDQTLTLVADVLRRHAPEGAAICRAGGEEFLIAYIWPTDDASVPAAEFCAAIHEARGDITASIGVATGDWHPTRGGAEALVEHLITAADAAMYEAKRLGGNRVHVAPPLTQLDVPECP